MDDQEKLKRFEELDLLMTKIGLTEDLWNIREDDAEFISLQKHLMYILGIVKDIKEVTETLGTLIACDVLKEIEKLKGSDFVSQMMKDTEEMKDGELLEKAKNAAKKHDIKIREMCSLVYNRHKTENPNSIQNQVNNILRKRRK